MKNVIACLVFALSLAATRQASAEDMPKLGIGISSAVSAPLTSAGASPAGLNFQAVSAKYFLSNDMAIEGNVGFGVVSRESANTSSTFLFGGKFHYVLKRYKDSHFFANAGLHLLVAGGPGAFGVLANANVGWEYIFTSGLPGLGLSPELGLNIASFNPDGANNGITTVGLGGYGSNLPFAMMNIRYYFN